MTTQTQSLPVLEAPGVQYPGRRDVAEIFTELRRQASAYKDYTIPTERIRMKLHPVYGIALVFPGDSSTLLYRPMTHRALSQLCQWIGLQLNSRLYKYLRFGWANSRSSRVSDRFWGTWCALVNDFFTSIKAKKLIRTLMRKDDTWYVRAILSDRYLIIPNDQLFLAVADRLSDAAAEPWDARLSEDTFCLYAVAEGITAQVRADRPFKSGDRWIGDEGDVVNAAIMIRNSETGQGGCEVCPAIMRKVTGAYFVRQNRLSRRHIGGRHEMDGMLSAETVRKKNALIYDEVGDYVASTFDPDRFQVLVDKLNDATQDEVDDPLAAVHAARVVYDLSEKRERALVKWLTHSGDRSRYGLAAAMSKEAHDNPGLDADEAVRLERGSTDLVENKTMLQLARAYKRAETKKAMKRSVKAASGKVAAENDLDI